MNEQESRSPWAVITAFSEELGELNEILEQKGMTDFVARLFVRTLFSVFDGYAYYVKQRAAAGARDAGIEFTEHESENISETRRHKLSDGTVELRPKIVPTRESLTFALKTYARVRHANAPLVAGALPTAFGTASEVRNRITHPKRPVDFGVSEVERQAIGALLVWLKEVMEWVRTEELKTLEELKQHVHDVTQQDIRKLD